MWECHCDCGKTAVITSGNLRRPHGNVSCGCQQFKHSPVTKPIHGQTRQKRPNGSIGPTKEYTSENSHRRRLRRYNLTEQDYNDLNIGQGFRCAICGVDPNDETSGLQRGFHIDHDHVTGKVRGLLCGRCNIGIGLLQESEEILQAAIKYLRGEKLLVALPSVS